MWDFFDQVGSKDRLAKAIGFIDYMNPSAGVQWIEFRFSLALKRHAYYTESELRQVYDQLEGFIADLVPPASAGKPIQTTVDDDGKWKHMHTQHIYVKYALLGILCAILLAYLVLCGE